MQTLTFRIFGIPFAKQSFRFTRTGHRYQSKEVVQAIDEALAVILAAKKAEKEIKVQIEVTKIEEPSEVEESIITSPTIPLKINEASESFEEIEEIIK